MSTDKRETSRGLERVRSTPNDRNDSIPKSHLQHQDQSVLAGEEDVGVAEHVVPEDEQQSQHQERGVLQEDADEDRHHLDGAAETGVGVN